MDDNFTLINALFLIEAAVLAVLIICRRRKYSKSKVEVPSRYSFDNAAPFEICFAVDNSRHVEPYEEIVPNFRLDFDAKHGRDIALRQVAQQELISKKSDQRYLLSILLKGLHGCEWLSIERITEPLTESADYAYSVAIKARGSRPCTMLVEIYLPVVNGQDRKINVGSLSLNEAFQVFALSKNLNEVDLENVDSSRNSRLMLFLQVTESLTIDFEKFDIEVDHF